MARDSTNRGGPRVGAGAKKKPLADKIAEGNLGKRELTVIDFDGQSVDLEGQPMPKPSKLLSSKQKDGKKLLAADIYKKTWEWLQERGCSSLVSPQLLERYAMSVARWTQCEEVISEYGFLAKHPTTGAAIASPY
ncbi:MAG: terminase, partial [Acidaminococcaceae bacterium]